MSGYRHSGLTEEEYNRRELVTKLAAEGYAVVTVADVESALRSYLAMLDYDMHKNLECGEETGKDTYPDEAAEFFALLKG